jgi:hypothetical protein
VERLLYCTGCTNATHAQQVLRDMEGDEDAAMEALIAGQGAALPCIPLPPPQQQMRTELPPSKQTVAVAEPKPNSRCTCGSKKKYKSCCGELCEQATCGLTPAPCPCTQLRFL